MTPTLLTDGYKIDHRRQYPDETKLVYSNFTPRKSRVPGVDKVVVFGIQAYILSTLIELWNKEFFQADINEITEEFMQEMTEYTLNPEAAKAIGIEHWKALHKLGYLPLEIKALPEGSVVPIRVPMFTVHSTHDDFYWLTNFIETDISAEVWPPCTSATTALSYKKIFTKWAIKTGGDLGFVPFQGHDFSYRGMFGRAAAQLSGAGHLLSFFGTDTIPAIKWLKKYYKADAKKGIIGCSVFATEHAVMCVGTGFYIKKDGLTWEKYGEAEFNVFKRLITELYPDGIVSIVCDTWDLWQVLTEYLVKLKKEVMARNGKVVVRPDSGDPVDILTGKAYVLEPSLDTPSGAAYEVIALNFNNGRDTFVQNGVYYTAFKNGAGNIEWTKKKPTPADRGVIELLWNTFGGSTVKGADGKEYRVLDPHIGAIYGDSITTDRAEAICERLAAKGFASTNWVAGIGSFTYTFVTRDTYGFAMKATYAEVEINGKREGIEVFKDPVTDDGTKKSARGLMQVSEAADGYFLVDQSDWDGVEHSAMKTVFLNGKLKKTQTLEEIRERLNAAV
jgi:nicotinamide phosphoribosyltransferase